MKQKRARIYQTNGSY